MVAPSHCLVPLDSLDPADAAPFTDAGLTSYHAVKQVAPFLRPGTAAVVIGIGGLGHLAVEFLRELTAAKIIAVDRDEAALELAADRGADLCLPSDKTTVQRVMEATNGLGAMAVLDVVGIRYHTGAGGTMPASHGPNGDSRNRWRFVPAELRRHATK